jgi:hypothetical protein
LGHSVPDARKLAEEIVANKIGETARIEKATAQFETRVRYLDNLMAVGGNYSGHLKERGLERKKWAAMPFFIRPPKAAKEIGFCARAAKIHPLRPE